MDGERGENDYGWSEREEIKYIYIHIYIYLYIYRVSMVIKQTQNDIVLL